MKIKRLTENDFPQLENLVNSNHGKKSIFFNSESNQIYKSRWLEGMKRWYLTGNETHYLYGTFDDSNLLLCCMGWRCDLPAPWDDGWVVGNLKSRPGYTVKSNGIINLWSTMFQICESKGLKRWHMIIPSDKQKNKYQVVADRYFKEIDSNYKYEWSIIVPPNTVPDVDWVWGTMGRELLNIEMRVRTGTKICDHP
jgi:hypothetical protein